MKAALAVVAAMALPAATSQAQVIITTDSTQDGGTLTVSPPAELVIHGNGNPLLTLTNGATTSGVEGVVVGSHAAGNDPVGGGDGQLLIEAGSILTNTGSGAGGRYGWFTVWKGNGYLGLNTGTTGSATITGEGSTWNNSGALYVGGSSVWSGGGTGTLIINDGGQVSSTSGYIGWSSGSTGTVIVTGEGSTWNNSGMLYVGRSGTGTLTVQSGGEVTAGTLYAAIGDLAGDGIIRAHAAVLDDVNLIFDSVTGTAPVVGFGSEGELRLDVDGTGNLGAGHRGEGMLTIREGITVTSTSGYLGWHSGSTGTATITGQGSTWTNSFSLSVGHSGTGTLTIEDGGQVSNTAGYLGRFPGSTGTAIVTGPDSTWDNSGSLLIGERGTGTLIIENGGRVDSIGAIIGRFSGSEGTATVVSEGSTWNNTGDFIFGGSSLTNASAGTGTLNVHGGGLVAVAGTTKVHEGDSVINLRAGGTFRTGSLDLSTNNDGLNWTGGTLELAGGSLTGLDTLNIPADGTLAGSGTVDGDVVSEEGGTVSPGQSTGILTIDGGYTQAATGTLAIELGGGTVPGVDHDQLVIDGQANLAGELALSLLPSFDPSPGDAMTVLSAGSRIGEFDQITGPDSFGDLRLITRYDGGDVIIHTVFPGDATLDGTVDDLDLQIVQQNLGMLDAQWVDGEFTGDGRVGLRDAFLLFEHFGMPSGGAGSGMAVPEPGSLALLGLGGLILAARRR